MPIDEQRPQQDQEQQIEPVQTETDAPERAEVGPEGDDGSVPVRLPRQTRAERRAERDPIRNYEAEIQRTRSEAEAARRELAELRGMLTQRQQAPVQSQSQDPYQQELSGIRREQEYISAALRGGQMGSAEEAERFRNRFYELEDRKESLREERLLRRAQGMQAPQTDVNEAILRSEYTEVFENPEALQAAQGHYWYLRQVKKQPNNIATARQAFRLAAENAGFIKQPLPKPSQVTQQSWGAVPSQPGARMAPGEVRLSKEQQKMARAMYPQLNDDDAFSKWAEMYHRFEKNNPVT